MTNKDFLIIAKALVQAKPKATSSAWTNNARLAQWKRDRSFIMKNLGIHNPNFKAQTFRDATDETQ